jgi:hypothetical protein
MDPRNLKLVSSNPGNPTLSPAPKLLDQVREKFRLKQYSLRTEI